MNPASQIDFVRGDTFSYASSVTMPAGTWTAACQLRSALGELVQDMTVTMSAPVAPATDWTILISATAAQTAAWPTKLLLGDVKFMDQSNPQVVMHTANFGVNVITGVTQ